MSQGQASPQKATIQTYDRSAGQFAERVWGILLERALDAFARRLGPGARVLDLGCGPGRDIALLRERGYRVIGLDRSMGMLREARRRVGGSLLCGDMHRLPLSEKSLDGIWLCAALLHLPRNEVTGALEEIRRVLRPNGVLYLSVQQGDGEGWKESEQGGRFFYYYQSEELVGLLEAAGYRIQEHWVKVEPWATWINLVARA